MNVLILGAGRMSFGLVFDLLQNESLASIALIDHDQQALNSVKDHFKNKRLSFAKLKADDLNGLKSHFKKSNGIISALPFEYNTDLTKLAIETSKHFVDLGGNSDIVERQIRLDKAARDKQISIVPDCGLAPGLVSVIAAYMIDHLARVDNVTIRVGGLPLSPRPPLNYKLLFSAHGLLNEYTEPVYILEDGRIKIVEPLTGLERLEFPRPFGTLEAFYTSGGTSTLPQTFSKMVTNLDYKTIRYPGHAQMIKSFVNLGFTNKKNTFKYRGNPHLTREVFEVMLSQALQYESDDVVLIRIMASGQHEGKKKVLVYETIEYADKKNELTAMMRMTAFPASIVLQMLLDGRIKDRGVLKQEVSVSGYDFLYELEKRDIRFNKKD